MRRKGIPVARKRSPEQEVFAAAGGGKELPQQANNLGCCCSPVMKRSVAFVGDGKNSEQKDAAVTAKIDAAVCFAGRKKPS